MVEIFIINHHGPLVSMPEGFLYGQNESADGRMRSGGRCLHPLFCFAFVSCPLSETPGGLTAKMMRGVQEKTDTGASRRARRKNLRKGNEKKEDDRFLWRCGATRS